MDGQGNGNGNGNRNGFGGFLRSLVTPSSISILVILFFVGVLLAIVLGVLFNKDFLKSLGQIEIARGLITSLISIGVIGIAIIIIAANYSTDDNIEKKDLYKDKFNRGKDILSLLIGVLGTIVGYYFGSTNGNTPSPSPTPSSLKSPAPASSPTPSPLKSLAPSPTPSPLTSPAPSTPLSP